jgi:hypothetical protein
MSLVSLPVELLLLVCTPLSVADLLSLSVQCVRLRDFIRGNPRLFWYKHIQIAHKTMDKAYAERRLYSGVENEEFAHVVSDIVIELPGVIHEECR